MQISVVLPHGKRMKGHVEPSETIGSLLARLELPTNMGLVTPSGRWLPESETIQGVHMQAGDEVFVQRTGRASPGQAGSLGQPSTFLHAVGLG